MDMITINGYTKADESPYSAEFIAIIKESAKDLNGKEVTAETLWRDLGV